MEQKSLPWTHPDTFFKILVYTDSFSTILDCRRVCKSWREWFNKYGFWTKYAKQRLGEMADMEQENAMEEVTTQGVKKHRLRDLANMEQENVMEKVTAQRVTNYRLERVSHGFDPKKMSESEAFALMSKLHKISRQHKDGLVPEVPQQTFTNTRKLKKMLDEKEGVKSLGPLEAFVRIKVKNPLVNTIVSEVINRYLPAIIVDKAEKTNRVLQELVIKSMFTRQDWVFIYFKPPDNSEIFKDAPKAMVYESEADMERALRDSQLWETQPRHTKMVNAGSSAVMAIKSDLENTSVNSPRVRRKRLADAASSDDQPGPSSAKVAKLDQEYESDEEDEDEPEEPTIYSECRPTTTNPHYPTLLELLDIDHDAIRQALITKFAIDKVLVVPKLDEILLQQSSCSDSIPQNFDAVGRDQDGNLSKINPSVDVHVSDQAVVRFIENIVNNDKNDQQLIFWGGKDIRHRWSKFSEQLAEAEKDKLQLKKDEISCSIPALAGTSKGAFKLPENMTEIEALLASRGISVVRPN
eukprot:TRINITY_DN4909_c0_g1_i10.p1 TRINITY_DN4909_c0_g1~~TRINITY_DN4909_c0_g1_i10.p1  ORF type:complete len:524 (-),score=89.78 TRINITY_DN4909_c0_g1_i10:202-1773(-)